VDSPGEWSTLGAVGRVLGFLPFLAFPLVGALVARIRIARVAYHSLMPNLMLPFSLASFDLQVPEFLELLVAA
jgi:hypothetical protein